MQQPERRPGEPEDAYQALLAFCGRGGRSVSATAGIVGRPRRTCYAWARAWDWKARALDPVGALEPAPATATITPADTARAQDLDRLRDDVRRTIYLAAAEAGEILIELARGNIPGGQVDEENGTPLVKAPVRMSAARHLLELAGLTPPKRMEIAKPKPEGYQTVRSLAARLSQTELELLVVAFDRAAPTGEASAPTPPPEVHPDAVHADGPVPAPVEA